MANLVDLLIGLGIDASDYAGGLDIADKHTDSFISKVTSTVGPALIDAFAMGTAAVADFAVSSIGAAADFEAGMLSFASVTGSAIEDAGLSLNDFQGLFLRLGSETAFSAAQAQEAAIELAKGGVAIPSIMGDATAATLDLASAGGLELASAAGIVAKQLGTWADKGVTAAQVANLLAQAANASTVDVDELAVGLANVQGTAETVGVEYQDLIQSMALLAPNFASASTAGTSLNNLLLLMQPTTADATAAMTDLGLITAEGQNVFFDAQGNFLGMANAAEQLQQATAGLSEAQQAQYLKTIFGNDAMGAAVALAAAGEEGFFAMGEAMAGAGTAAEQAGLKNQGFKFAVDSLFGSIETLQIIIGSALLPILTELVNSYIIPAVNAFTEFATHITSAEDPIFEITNAIYQFSPVLGDLIGYLLVVIAEGDRMNDFFVNLPGPILQVIRIIELLADLIGNNLQPILIAVAAILGGVIIGAIYTFIAGIVAVAAPIIATIAVVAALYTAFENNFFGIRDVVTAIMAAVWGVISSVISTIRGFWEANNEDILVTASKSWTSIQNIVTGVLDILKTIVTTVLNAISSFWTNHKDQIVGTITALWTIVKGLFSGALQVIEGLVQAAVGLIHGDLDGFRAGAEKVVQGLFTALEGIFKGGLDLLKGSFELALDLIRDVLMAFVGDANSLGGNIINGIIDGVKGGVGALIDAVQGAAMSALDAAKAALGISSPSKKGYYIGEMFMLGPINAIYDMLPTLARAGSAVGDALTVNGSATVPAYSGVANSAATMGGAFAASSGDGRPNYHIDAHYTKYENERSLRDTIRMETILNTPASP